MEATLVTVTLKAKVDLVTWDNEYIKFVSFADKEEAVAFWALRQQMLPAWNEEICLLSHNPFNNRYYMMDLTFEEPEKDPLKKAQQEAAFWHHGWYEGRLKYGHAVWDAYYKGVRDEQADKVYDKEHGQKHYYPEIK